MVKKEDASKYLNDVPPDKCFWVNNGPVLKNLYELQDALKSISEDTYTHHANKDKNDFSRWVEEVIGDAKLAKELMTARNMESAFKKITARVETLKRVVG